MLSPENLGTQRLLKGCEDRRPRPQREVNYRLGVSIINLTDEDPPLAPQELGYDTSTHSFMTRTIKVSLSQRFGGRD